MQILQRLRIFEQHTHTGTATGTYHNSHRSCQTQRTGAGNDQNRNGIGQAEFQTTAQNHPNHKSYHCDAHHHRHKDACNLICQTGNGRFRATGFFHHVDDLGQGGVFAHLFCPEFQITFRIDGGSCHAVTDFLLHRDAFTGEGALIHRAATLCHDTVHRDAAAGANHQNITHPDFFHRDFRFHTVPQHMGRLGTEIH